MKITQITLNNFKAFKGERIINTNNSIVCFVGENNSGKTTIFAAIDFLKNGIPKEKSIDDYKNKNNSNQDVWVEIIMQGKLKEVIKKFSEDKYNPYVYYDDNGIETIKIKRSSEQKKIIQSKSNKSVDLDVKKILFFNPTTEQFENVTGFDTASNSLFETQFIWSDMKAADMVDFGSTKILGKLLKETSQNFESSQQWVAFKKAHEEAFLTSENALIKKSDSLIKEIEKSLQSFYGNAVVKFDFQTPDPASFIKLGDICIDDGINTSITEKGSGMQRAFAFSVIKVYADFLTKHKTDIAISKPIFFFIDEPEISLHPKAQKTLFDALKEISKSQQVFVTTHSPYFLMNFKFNENEVILISKEKDLIKITPAKKMDTFNFSPTLAEVNYFAFNLESCDFHNELYGYIAEETKNFYSNELDKWLSEEHKISQDKKWKTRSKKDNSGTEQKVSLMTFIRHSIHHPENTHNNKYSNEELKKSTQQMLEIITAIKLKNKADYALESSK